MPMHDLNRVVLKLGVPLPLDHLLPLSKTQDGEIGKVRSQTLLLTQVGSNNEEWVDNVYADRMGVWRPRTTLWIQVISLGINAICKSPDELNFLTHLL